MEQNVVLPSPIYPKKSGSHALNSILQKRKDLIYVSVVIPTYRRASLLQNCLNALMCQSLDKSVYEIIVVSDGPDEETATMVKKFGNIHPAVHYLFLAGKKGPAAARNLGWQTASGKLVAFTDDDCLPDKFWLSSLHKFYSDSFKNGLENGIAFTGKIKVPLSTLPTDFEKNTSHLETADFVTANCCCTRSALEKVGGFDERFSMAWREDSDLEFKFLQQKIPIVKVEGALVIHPVRKANWGISIKEQKKGIFNALLYKKFPELYRKKIQASPPWNYYMIIIAFCCIPISVFLQLEMLALVFAFFWLSLTVNFIFKRLRSTSKSGKHVMEMIATSFIIPFVSVYWQLLGAIKYKVLFL
jgi:glycosyltransferase involved in cell wall biosynthesis